MKVDVGIACGKNVPSAWWAPTMAAILMWDRLGDVEISKLILPDTALTDANRNRIAHDFLAGEAEWLLQLDDDTVPPLNALPTLLALDQPFCAGLYHLKDDHEAPVAFMRNDYGLYAPLEHYVPGEILPVDLVGMGCTLIHRSVFEDIRRTHRVALSAGGQTIPIARRLIDSYSPPFTYGEHGSVIGDFMLTKVEFDHVPRNWPFYAFSTNRTEDLWFCELALEAGYRPILDTGLVCEHLGGHRNFSGVNYRRRMIAEEVRGLRDA